MTMNTTSVLRCLCLVFHYSSAGHMSDSLLSNWPIFLGQKITSWHHCSSFNVSGTEVSWQPARAGFSLQQMINGVHHSGALIVSGTVTTELLFTDCLFFTFWTHSYSFDLENVTFVRDFDTSWSRYIFQWVTIKTECSFLFQNPK